MDALVAGMVWTLALGGAGVVGFFSFWRLRSMVRVWRAPARPLQSVQAVIWRDPGDPSRLDLAAGPGGRSGEPAPPFTFLEEHLTGSQPCVSVVDARGRKWRVKWGDEVNAEVLATRLAWAAGYFVETNYLVRHGRIVGAPALQRGGASVAADGEFRDARFEFVDPAVISHFEEHSWAWNDNPFGGTPELNGLKIVMMWVSNWDAKDVRDVARGSNTAIFEYPLPNGMREARYLITDWGGAFGRWGSVIRRGRWDCHAFAEESRAFVSGVDGDLVRFGYSGQRTSDILEGIRVQDVGMLMRTLGRLTERQIAEAVAASGGTDEEVKVFARALRDRLDQLMRVSAGAWAPQAP